MTGIYSQPIQPARPRSSCLKITAILFIVLCILAIIIGVTLVLIFGPNPEGLTISVESPGIVQINNEFSYSVTVGNVGKQTLTVNEIDLPNILLDAAPVTNISPSSPNHTNFGSNTGYDFTLILEPGQSYTVTFTSKATTAGDFTGQIDAVVGVRRKSADIRVVIKGDGSVVATSIPPSSTLIPTSNVEVQPQGNTSNTVPFRSVVEITALVNLNGQQVEGWYGSGTIISADGMILTNAHVVLSDADYKVTALQVALTSESDTPPQKMYMARVVQADANLDLAVIKITTDLHGNPVDGSSLNLPVVPLGDSDSLELGDTLTILGYPGIGGATITLTRGEVSGFTAETGYGNRALVKTSATIAGGNSGGSAVNSRGELVAIPTEVGSGGESDVVDCRPLADTNDDGRIDNNDSCVPTGGFINALRPVKLALPLIQAAQRGEVSFSEPTQAPQNAPQTGGTMVSDDFSDTSSGWGENFSGTDYFAGYVDGHYEFRVFSDYMYVWNTINSSYGDMVITTKVEITKSSRDGGFGLVCREQGSTSLYGLWIGEDGYSEIVRILNNQNDILATGNPVSNLQVGQVYTLQAFCVGDNLSLYMDGHLLVETTDNTLGSGNPGLFVSTNSGKDFQVAFDDFLVQQP